MPILRIICYLAPTLLLASAGALCAMAADGVEATATSTILNAVSATGDTATFQSSLKAATTDQEQDEMVQQFTPAQSFAFLTVYDTSIHQVQRSLDNQMELHMHSRVNYFGTPTPTLFRGQAVSPHNYRVPLEAPPVAPGPREYSRNIWYQAFGYAEEYNGQDGDNKNDDFLGYNNSGFGQVLGSTWTLGDTAVGLAYGYTTNRIVSQKREGTTLDPNNGTLDTHSIMGYGSLNITNNLFSTFQIGGTNGEVVGTRNPGDGLTAVTYKAKLDTIHLKALLGYRWWISPKWDSTLKLAIGHYDYTMHGYTESNGGTVAKNAFVYSNQDILLDINCRADSTLQVVSTFGYRHVTNARGAQASITLDGLTYPVNGIGLVENMFILDAGLEKHFFDRLDLNVKYLLRAGTCDYIMHGGMASFEWGF